MPSAIRSPTASSLLWVVLRNDLDNDGQLDPATLEIISGPTAGAAAVVDGQIEYTTPVADLGGTASLTYRVCDNGAPVLCGEAVMTVEMLPPTFRPEPPTWPPRSVAQAW